MRVLIRPRIPLLSYPWKCTDTYEYQQQRFPPTHTHTQNPLVKQLSEVFQTETPKSNLLPEPVLPPEAPSFELDLPLGNPVIP